MDYYNGLNEYIKYNLNLQVGRKNKIILMIINLISFNVVTQPYKNSIIAKRAVIITYMKYLI